MGDCILKVPYHTVQIYPISYNLNPIEIYLVLILGNNVPTNCSF